MSMERKNEIKCRYCHYMFTPEPVVVRDGKKFRKYIECPRCGNGLEYKLRRSDAKKVYA